VLIVWDDSDGWYDHAYHKPTSASFDAQADQVNGPGKCGTGTPSKGVEGKPVNGRCGPGTRIPFLVVSPWARANYVDHALITQASVTRFIEDNWLSGKRLGGGSFDATAGSLAGLFDFAGHQPKTRLFLDPNTGDVLKTPPVDSAN
jgi:phospholipase C